MALRRRRLDTGRRRTAASPGGVAGLELKSMIGLLGFTGIPDSTLKFRHVREYFHDLRDVVKAEMFDQNVGDCIALLYGSALGSEGTLLKARFETLAAHYRAGHRETVEEGRKILLADLSKEIENYEQLQALYAAEHLEADAVQHNAELLLPSQELDAIIRYETHLEDQVERKLRQFYARRREAVLTPADSLPEIPAEAIELACPQGIA